MKVYAIVVTYNGEKWIDKCLKSLYNSSFPVSVIVVDNGSKDRTLAIIQEKYSEAVLIQPSMNLGFGKANNLGIKYAVEQKADYVFLLNQDAYVDEKAIAQLINCAIANPEYGVLSPIHLNGCGNELDRNFAIHISHGVHTATLISDLYKQRLQEIYSVDFVNAAAWLITDKCLELVGGFDPYFFMYKEDDEYIKRVHYFKKKVGIVPGAIIFHDRENRKVEKTRAFYTKWYELNSKLILSNVEISLVRALYKFYKHTVTELRKVEFIKCLKTFLSLHFNILFLHRKRKFASSRKIYKWIL